MYAQGKFAGLEPDDEPRRTARDEATGVVTLLPKQLWSSFKVNDGEVVCEVGWVLGDGSAVTSTCVLSKDGEVKASFPFGNQPIAFLLSKNTAQSYLRCWLDRLQEIAAATESRVSEAT